MFGVDFVATCVSVAVTANGRRRRNAMVRECVDDSGGGGDVDVGRRELTSQAK